jgi:hypothetical protein
MPVEFWALSERHQESIRLSFMPFAPFTAMYFNCHRGEGVEPRTADDYIPKMNREKEKPAEPTEKRASLSEIRLAQWRSYAKFAGEKMAQPKSA